MVYRIGPVSVDPALREVRQAGDLAQLGSRAFDLLLALVEHRDRLLTKNELLDLVWPNLVVEENNLQVQIGTLRKLLGAKAIATIPGRGYRFSAEVEVQAGADSAAVPATAAAATAAATSTPAAVEAIGNLPPALAPLLGRSTEHAQTLRMVREHRLVTLAGPGGIGKTSLARSVAREAGWQFRDRAWLVELASVSDGHSVAAAVAQALRISLPGRLSPTDELVERIRNDALLIVLDNCEHLVDAVAAFAQCLLDQAPGVHLLVTTQEPLKLPEEQVIRLGTLSVPDEASLPEAAAHGAVALFVARVQAVKAGFRLDESNVVAVVDICRQLDGMALAIELAAARVPLLGVEGVRSHLAERLRLLTSGSRTAPSRHRTLRATLDWSHGLLSAHEQTVFRRLGVFVGGFGLELAQQVAADDEIDAWSVLDHLGALIDKSIVVADAGDTPRYHLLETARAYAIDRLVAAGEHDALRQWHARCIRDLIDPRSRLQRLGRESPDAWCLACRPEIDNLRAAIDWCARPDGDRPLALALVNVAAELMYQVGRYPECVRWMTALESLIDESTPPAMVAQFRFGLALVGMHGGLPAERRLQLLLQAKPVFEQFDSRYALPLTLMLLAYNSILRNDFAGAEVHLADCARIVDHDTPAMIRASRLYQLGMAMRYRGRGEEALAALTEALPLARQSGSERTLFYVLNNLAAVHLEIGHVDEAVAQQRALLDRVRRSPLTDAQIMAFALAWFAHALTVQGSLDEAMARMREAEPHMRRSVGVRHFAGMLALLAARRGRLAEAMRLVGCDDAARAERGESRSIADEQTLATVMAIAEASHTADQLAAWRAEGATLDADAATALAFA